MSPATETTAPSPPLRDSTEIQGDILAGFRKDHVRLLFLRFDDSWHARLWLGELRKRIATTRDVSTFNLRFRHARLVRGGQDPEDLRAAWRAVSFTHAGLVRLVGGSPLNDVPRGSTQEAFVQGSAARAHLVGDTGTSAPERWLFGAQQHDPVHAVLTLAADDEADLTRDVEQERQEAACHGLTVVFEQEGATLPDDHVGHEHFGFKDAISQPGVVDFDLPDPDNPEMVLGKPGTRLIPSGEFVVGRDVDHRLPSWLPQWMNDGSFHVVRRLAQDVPGWWQQVADRLAELKREGAVPEEVTDDWLAARLVGRWRSGAPVPTFPDADPGPLGPDKVNDFGFGDDVAGRLTPLCSHLRKTNPRDGLQVEPSDDATVPEQGGLDGRRLMRRGVPFGPLHDATTQDEPRGLVFVSYQSDLVAQFEFVQQAWVNDENLPEREPPVGRDAVIGQDTVVAYPADPLGPTACVALEMKQYVHTQGAVYAFAPSMSALRQLAEGTVPVGGEPLADRVMPAPTIIRRGEVISAGRARLRFEADNDLVVRDENERERWRAGVNRRGAIRAELREDGNLVMPTMAGEIIWSSGTAGHPGATLVVGVDGDVSIRAADGSVLWHTDTAR
ncbi:Dyp-type peroxidase [Streptomyces sp. 4N509B]|uniref:Dyp-type peroxidase n=1 Tax=Streptomyces sp. 4N509B TaxID=3457413 RepID=UPI003FD0BF6E